MKKSVRPLLAIAVAFASVGLLLCLSSFLFGKSTVSVKSSEPLTVAFSSDVAVYRINASFGSLSVITDEGAPRLVIDGYAGDEYSLSENEGVLTFSDDISLVKRIKSGKDGIISSLISSDSSHENRSLTLILPEKCAGTVYICLTECTADITGVTVNAINADISNSNIGIYGSDSYISLTLDGSNAIVENTAFRKFSLNSENSEITAHMPFSAEKTSASVVADGEYINIDGKRTESYIRTVKSPSAIFSASLVRSTIYILFPTE